jgi:hypothetical protein
VVGWNGVLALQSGFDARCVVFPSRDFDRLGTRARDDQRLARGQNRDVLYAELSAAAQVEAP